MGISYATALSKENEVKLLRDVFKRSVTVFETAEVTDR